LWAANFSSAPTSSPSFGCSPSGSKVIPSGALSISIPASLTTARPTEGTSTRAGAVATGPAPSDANASGSKAAMSVKRQASSEVVGSGSAR
jgi:hypothetical protein